MTKTPHILIAEARFYEDICDLMFEGVKSVLGYAGASFERIEVPGALELPAAIKLASEGGNYDAYVALGCVIRGETYHFEVVSNESARGLMDLSVQQNLAIANGVLTCETREQAITRADPKQKNKGASFAQAALDVLAIKEKYGVK